VALFNWLESSKKPDSVRSIPPILVSPSHKWQQVHLSSQAAILSVNPWPGKGIILKVPVSLWHNCRAVRAAYISTVLSIWMLANSSYELYTWKRRLSFKILHITQLSVCLITVERVRKNHKPNQKKLFPGAQSLRF